MVRVKGIIILKVTSATEFLEKKNTRLIHPYTQLLLSISSSRYTREILEIAISGSNARCDLSQVITSKLLIYVFQQ